MSDKFADSLLLLILFLLNFKAPRMRQAALIGTIQALLDFNFAKKKKNQPPMGKVSRALRLRSIRDTLYTVAKLGQRAFSKFSSKNLILKARA